MMIAMTMKANLTNEKYIRQFNTSGICNPISHFYISRIQELGKTLAAIKGVVGEKGGQYFTMFASRQLGKTTFVEELVKNLDADEYCPVVISFETMIDIEESVFYERFSEKLRESCDEDAVKAIGNFKDGHDFERCVKQFQETIKKKFVLIIDEFDGINKDYIGNLLHVFRDIYLDRQGKYNLHSLILIGVRNITDVNLDNASPFNTNDEIQIPSFTKEQVFDLMHQYEEETQQNFAQEVKEQVFYNTQGQPGLTNALCKMLVEDYNPGDKKEIDIRAFNRMFSFFIHGHISKNAVNVINKARQYKNEVINLFNTREKVEFHIDTDWIGYLHINGAITRDVVEDDKGNIREYVKFANPIYQKKLYYCFKPDDFSEGSLYIAVDKSFRQYINADNTLNILAILQNYQNYVNQRGSKAFDYAPRRKDGARVEAVYHYSLDAYLSSVAQAIGAASVVEFPTGNGKVDIFFLYEGSRYVIEIKSFLNLDQLDKGKQQLARYAKSEGLSEAYLVIFSEVHPREGKGSLTVYTQEQIDGISIQSVLVNVNF